MFLVCLQSGQWHLELWYHVSMKRWIQNFDELATNTLRHDALTILEAGLDAIDTRSAVRQEVTYEKDTNIVCFKNLNICLADFEKIFFVAIGKCAVDASLEIEKIFGDAITAGYVLDIQGGVFRKLISKVGTHPLPSEANKEATESIVELLSTATEKDLVIVVISGGGSALLCSPFDMTCEKLSQVTKTLMEKGATIEEMNTIRKHLSKVQGGQLAQIAYPAQVVALIFSDVPGDDLSLIASGPVTKDITTKADAEEILARYGIGDTIEISQNSIVETPKEDKYFEHVQTILLVNNAQGLEAMKRCAEKLGYSSQIVDTKLQGEARMVGATISSQPMKKNTALFYGGETTVTVTHKGKGGRNQEAALSALRTIPEDTIFVACASDGHDNGDVAGAFADKDLQQSAVQAKLDVDVYLRENNSYPFFEALHTHIKTGITGINVSDFYCVLRK